MRVAGRRQGSVSRTSQPLDGQRPSPARLRLSVGSGDPCRHPLRGCPDAVAVGAGQDRVGVTQALGDEAAVGWQVEEQGGFRRHGGFGDVHRSRVAGFGCAAGLVAVPAAVGGPVVPVGVEHPLVHPAPDQAGERVPLRWSQARSRQS
jgi:hypothetical protein